jgi:tetratricopeptide (TPR) repeat protein
LWSFSFEKKLYRLAPASVNGLTVKIEYVEIIGEARGRSQDRTKMKRREGSSAVWLIGILFFFFSDGFGARAEKAQDEMILKSEALTLRQGKVKEALNLCGQMPKSARPSAALSALCGLALLDGGEFEKARQKFEAACQANPECPEAKLGLAELEMSRLRWPQALPWLRQAQTTKLLLFRAVTALSRCLQELGQRQEALSLLRQLEKSAGSLNKREIEGLKQRIGYLEALARLGQADVYGLDHVAPKTQLSFTSHDGHILIPVTLNGLRVKCHVDTGNNGGLAIDQKTAAALKIEAVAEEKTAGVEGESVEKIGLIDELRIGDSTISHVPVSLVDSCLGGAAEANLGLAILRRFNLSIDYKNKQFVLYRLSLAPDQPSLEAKAAAVIPFWVRPLIIIRAKINGGPEIPCILDTGAGIPVLHVEYYYELLPKGVKPAVMPGGKKGLPYLLVTLELNGLTFRNVFSVVLDLSSIYETGSFYIPVIVGASVLQNSVIHFDFKNMELAIGR